MSDERLVLEAVEHLYRAALGSTSWPDALDHLRGVFGSDACALARYDFRLRDGAYLHQAGYRPDLIARYPGRFARVNLWLRDEAPFRTPGAAWIGRDLTSDRELLQSPFYAEWLRSQDLLHQSCGVIARDGDAVIYLENLRRTARKAFDRRHLRPYALLLPHLELAWTLARVLPEAERRVPPLERMAERAMAPALLLDEAMAGGTVPARALRGGATAFGGGGRPWTTPPWATELASEVITLSERRAGNAGPRAIASMDSEPGEEAPETARLAAISGTPFFRAAAAEDRLRLLYNLTRAEARLALLLARGHTLHKTAETLGISLATVRTHLQRIFAKTGTGRQSEVVVLLLTGPAGLQGE